MLPILGYKPSDLLDKALYECHHGADSEILMAAFKNGKQNFQIKKRYGKNLKSNRG